jgi:hypothetical protein
MSAASVTNRTEEVIELLRQLHLANMRKSPPELLAAKAQRWEPVESPERFSGRRASPAETLPGSHAPAGRELAHGQDV